MSICVTLLLGRRPGPHSIVPSMVEHLRRRGTHVSLLLWRPDELPEALFSSDLVVLRGLGARATRALEALSRRGVRCCNSVAATCRARDKPAAFEALLGAGVPIPRTEVGLGWEEALGFAKRRDGVVVKAATGSRGAGVLIVPAAALPPEPPFPGPYLLQELVPRTGPDRKLYVIGDRVAGVERPWPPKRLRDKLGSPFAPDAAERAVALAAGEALGLEIYGVDLLATPDGPIVVDVNAFPGFKGVEGAAASLAEYLLRAARMQKEAVACAS